MIAVWSLSNDSWLQRSCRSFYRIRGIVCRRHKLIRSRFFESLVSKGKLARMIQCFWVAEKLWTFIKAKESQNKQNTENPQCNTKSRKIKSEIAKIKS